MGAHHGAPSEILVDDAWVDLASVIAADPGEALSLPIVDRFGPRLPFLFKVLAAGQPLSLQVHPTVAQAREGYVREDAAGIGRNAPNRTYKDRNHKPEVLCALTPFEALSGFRPAAEAAAVFGALCDAGATALGDVAVRLGRGDLVEVFWDFWRLPASSAVGLVQGAVDAAVTLGSAPVDDGSDTVGVAAHLVGILGPRHPTDIGVLVALLLNHLRLEPGEAIYAPAGRIHCYLGGLGLELLANSDNVVRGGLTSKHVDLAELARVLEVRPETVVPLRPERHGAEETYLTPSSEFRLSRIELRDGAAFAAEPNGPEILLCTAGSMTLGGIVLDRGQSMFVPGVTRRYDVHGTGTVYRASVGV